MFTCWVFSPLINDRMWGEIGEPIMGIVFVIEKNLTSRPRITLGRLTSAVGRWLCHWSGRNGGRMVVGGGLVDRATLR